MTGIDRHDDAMHPQFAGVADRDFEHASDLRAVGLPGRDAAEPAGHGRPTPFRRSGGDCGDEHRANLSRLRVPP